MAISRTNQTSYSLTSKKKSGIKKPQINPKTGLPYTNEELGARIPKESITQTVEIKDHIPAPGTTRHFASLVERIKLRLSMDEEYVEFKNVEVVDDKMEPTGEHCNVRVKIPSLDAVAMHYLAKAMKSDKVLLDLINRIDGYPVAKSENKNLNLKRIEIVQVKDDKPKRRRSKD